MMRKFALAKLLGKRVSLPLGSILILLPILLFFGWGLAIHLRPWSSRPPYMDERRQIDAILDGLRYFNDPYLTQLSERMSVVGYFVDVNLSGDDLGYIHKTDPVSVFLSPHLFKGVASANLPIPDGTLARAVLLNIMVHETAHLDALWERDYWWEKYIDDGVHDWIDDYYSGLEAIILRKSAIGFSQSP